MLFNPKWKTKTDPLSTASFVTWLERQPADSEYNFLSCKECAIAQYAQSLGKDYYDIPLSIRWQWNFIAAPGSFGEAATRGRSLVTDI
jgi:hypothetical protein